MPSDTPFLKGKKISLRAFRQSDLEAYKTWLDNEEVTHFLEMGARPARNRLRGVFPDDRNIRRRNCICHYGSGK